MTDIAAILWIALAGYGFSVLQAWKHTASYLREQCEKLYEEADNE